MDSTKNGEPDGSPSFRRVLRLGGGAQLVVDRLEGAAERGAERDERGDDDDCDEGSDEAVLDGGGSVLVLEEVGKHWELLMFGGLQVGR